MYMLLELNCRDDCVYHNLGKQLYHNWIATTITYLFVEHVMLI